MRFMLPVLVATLLIPTANAQVVFSDTTVPFQDNLYAAVDNALVDHQGDVAILFYNPNDDIGSRIASCMFSTDESATYIKENFELIAVEIGSDDWKRLQAKYRPGAEADWPYVVIDVRRFMSHVEFHGWENCTLGAPLPRFKTLKEHGATFDNVNDY